MTRHEPSQRMSDRIPDTAGDMHGGSFLTDAETGSNGQGQTQAFDG